MLRSSFKDHQDFESELMSKVDFAKGWGKNKEKTTKEKVIEMAGDIHSLKKDNQIMGIKMLCYNSRNSASEETQNRTSASEESKISSHLNSEDRSRKKRIMFQMKI